MAENVLAQEQVFIIIDSLLLFHGESPGLEFPTLTNLFPDATVIWLTYPKTGFLFPAPRSQDKQVSQKTRSDELRKKILNILRYGFGRPLPVIRLTTAERQFMSRLLRGIGISLQCRIDEVSEKTLYYHHQASILHKTGIRSVSWLCVLNNKNIHQGGQLWWANEISTEAMVG